MTELVDESTGEISAEFPLPVLERMDVLRGAIRDAWLERFKVQPKPWPVMSESEQQAVIDGLDRAARYMVTQACQIMAANGHAAFRAALDAFKVKGEEVMIQLKAQADGGIGHALLDHDGPLMLVLASPEAYMGETAPAKPDPEEPPLFEFTDAGKQEETVVVPMKRGRGRPPLSEVEKAQRAAQREADRREEERVIRQGDEIFIGPTVEKALDVAKRTAASAAANAVQQVPLVPSDFSQTSNTMQGTTQPKPKSIEELLTVRHPNGATPLMIVAAGFHLVDIADLVKQRKVEMIDGYYVWLEPDAVPPEDVGETT